MCPLAFVGTGGLCCVDLCTGCLGGRSLVGSASSLQRSITTAMSSPRRRVVRCLAPLEVGRETSFFFTPRLVSSLGYCFLLWRGAALTVCFDFACVHSVAGCGISSVALDDILQIIVTWRPRLD